MSRQRQSIFWTGLILLTSAGLGLWVVWPDSVKMKMPGASDPTVPPPVQPSVPRDPASPVPSVAGSIQGTVAEPIGTVIEGATVCARRDSPSNESTAPTCATTDERGVYRLADLFPAPYLMTATARGFLPAAFPAGQPPQAVDLRAGPTRNGVDVILEPGGVEAHGMVRDRSGEPIVGAFVASWLDADYRQIGATAATDNMGRFRLWVALGRSRLSAQADGYASAHLIIGDPTKELVILLTPGAVLSGRVVRAIDGAPLAGLQVEAGQVPARQGPILFDTAQTDPDGRFDLEGLAPGRYQPFVMTKGWYGRAATSVALGPMQRSADLSIEVRSGFSVTGAVVLAGSREPCPAGRVTLRSPAAGEERAQALGTDGGFFFTTLVPGTYGAQVECVGFRSLGRDTRITVSNRDIDHWLLEVERASALRGVIVDDTGEPLGGIKLRARRLTPGRYGGSNEAVSAVDGAFAFYGLRPAGYAVEPWVGRWLTEAAVEVELSPETDPPPARLVVERLGSLRIDLVDLERQPIAGLVVDLARGKERHSLGSESGPDGFVSIDGLSAGDYRVTARHPLARNAAGSENVTVRAAEVSEVTVICESQSGAITGRVIDSGDEPVPDVVVRVMPSHPSRRDQLTPEVSQDRWLTHTDPDGTFHLEGLPLGRHRLLAEHYTGAGGMAWAATGAAVTIRLESTATVGGIALVTGGAPPDIFSITAQQAQTGDVRRESFFHTRGRWQLDTLRAGRWRLTAEANGASGRLTLDVRAGEQRDDIRIELAGRGAVTGLVVDAENREPLANVMVSLRPGSVAAGDQVAGGDRVATDAGGHFTLRGIPSGRAELGIEEPPGYTRLWGAFLNVVPGEMLDLGEVRLEPDPLVRGGEKGMLGFRVHWPPAGDAPEDFRVVVTEVKPESPAELAGLRAGDVITAVNGEEVTGPSHYRFWGLVRTARADATVLVLGDGRALEIVAGAWSWP